MNAYVSLKNSFNEVKCCKYTILKGPVFVTNAKHFQVKSGFITNSENQFYKKRELHIYRIEGALSNLTRSIKYSLHFVI